VTVTVNSRKDFTLENYRRIALGRESVRIGAEAVRTMTRTRESFFEMLEADPTIFVYGVTSGYGMGSSKRVVVDASQRRVAPVGARAGGAGFGGSFLPERVVRGIVFARLASFIEGHGKARPEVAKELAAMLDRRLPNIPLEGQVWAGEIVPLGHLAEGFKIELELGEGLLNGSPCAAALAGDIALQSPARLALAERVFCLSIEAVNAPLGAYDRDLAQLWGDPYEGRAIRNVNRLLAGVPRRNRRFYQAPVSWELVVRVLGQAHRTVATLDEVAETSLASSTLNPIYEPPSRKHPHGRAFSNGGYHNAMASPALDMVNASWADLCTIANHHVQKMRRSPVSLLPEDLRHPGEDGGYGMGLLGLGQIDFVEEARIAAQRTFVPAAEGDAADDIAEPVFLAYKKSLKAAHCLDCTLAVLAVTSSQALSITGRQAPPKLRGFLESVRAHCPPIHISGRKRALGREMDSLREALSSAALAGEVDLNG